MKYYQEITLIDSADVRFFELWSKVYTQIHLALVEHAKATNGEDATHGDIGVSFPDYRFAEKSGKPIAILGSKLRVFASAPDQLAQLNLGKWLERLADYVHIKSPNNVPNEHSHITVSRARQVKNLDRVARQRQKHQKISFEEAKENIIKRYAERHGLDIEKAKQAYEKPTLQPYPYINMQSLGGGNRFSLELKQTAAEKATIGKFNTYGLSSTTTVPHW